METIEPAMVDDIPQLAELLNLLFTQEAEFRSDPQKQLRGLRMIIESPQTGIIFLARSESGVAGMVSLLFTISTAEGGPVCWLEDMVVRPEHRGEGLGSQLLERAIEYASEHRFSRISLLTDRVNNGAIRFYGKHGFEESAMTALRLRIRQA